MNKRNRSSRIAVATVAFLCTSLVGMTAHAQVMYPPPQGFPPLPGEDPPQGRCGIYGRTGHYYEYGPNWATHCGGPPYNPNGAYRMDIRWGEHGETSASFCMAVGTTIYLGVRGFPYATQPHHIYDLYWGVPCTPEEQPEPPQVHVRGKVVAPINTGDVARPYKHARYELWYFGYDGAGSALTWRPVLDGADENGRPAGEPVAGFLDENGGYALDFIYPQEYRLRNGTLWSGCLEPEQPIDFLESYACDAVDLQLRVYPENGTGGTRRVFIFVPGGGSFVDAPPEFIDLGHYFQRPPQEEVTVADSEPALTYRAIYNAIDLVGADSLGDIFVKLDPSVTTSHYTNGVIFLRPDDAGTSTPEHELGHVYARGLGALPPGDYCGGAHQFTRASNEVCAFSEGFATFFGAAAEERAIKQGRASSTNIETCVQSSDVESLICEEGPTVEGNVAAALLDLVDIGPDRRNDFVDRTSHSIQAVFQVMKAYRPGTLKNFWYAWAYKGPAGFNADDVTAMYMNTLVYTFRADDGPGQLGEAIAGSWKGEACADCVGGQRHVSDPSDGPAAFRWTIDTGVVSQHPVTGEPVSAFDVWVHVPAGVENLDPRAVFHVKTINGFEPVEVDLALYAGSWVKLPAAYFGVFVMDPHDDNEVKLTNGPDPSKVLAVDAVIVDIHQG
jgi:hypothetical protein